MCRIKSSYHIVGILQAGPKDQFEIGHNYFINVLKYNHWIHHHVRWHPVVQDLVSFD